MNIIYFCDVNRSSAMAVGVFKKIIAQRKVLQKEGHYVYLAYPENTDKYVIIDDNEKEVFSFSIIGLRGNARSKKIFTEVKQFIFSHEIKILYSRFETYSAQTAKFYRVLQKRGIVVLLEVPTYPISQRWTSIKTSFLQRKINIGLRQVYNATINSLGIFMFRRGVDRIVTNNGFNRIWGVPTIKISNGIDVESIPIRGIVVGEREDIHLIAVANVARWHGYDRVIAGMVKYYAQSTVPMKVYFDVVGPGLEVKNLIFMAERGNIKEYVRFLGTVVGKELDDLFDKADIGVSVLGVHRNRLTYCDSLKSREYCARCLPFVTEKTEQMYTGQPFVMHVEADESSLDINQVIDFWKSCNNDEKMVERMREYAQEICDWSVAFQEVVKFVENQQ